MRAMYTLPMPMPVDSGVVVVWPTDVALVSSLASFHMLWTMMLSIKACFAFDVRVAAFWGVIPQLLGSTFMAGSI